jgi:hypothetical protein
MARWEYRTLLAGKQGEHMMLHSVDGDTNAAVKEWVSRFMGRDPVPYELPTYLRAAGQECWEVVGISPATTGGDYQKECEVVVILKRPIEG